MITAIVLVHVAADRIPEAAQAIADLPGVDEVYSCAGDVDLVAIVKVADGSAETVSSPSRRSRSPTPGQRGGRRRCPARPRSEREQGSWRLMSASGWQTRRYR